MAEPAGVIKVNFTVYPRHQAIIKDVARKRGYMTKRGPNDSMALRDIIEEWAELNQQNVEDSDVVPVPAEMTR